MHLKILSLPPPCILSKTVHHDLCMWSPTGRACCHPVGSSAWATCPGDCNGWGSDSQAPTNVVSWTPAARVHTASTASQQGCQAVLHVASPTLGSGHMRVVFLTLIS